MTTENDLIQQLFVAQRDGRHDVDGAPYAALDRDAAYRLQLGVMQKLGEETGMLKVGIAPDGVAIVAPIYKSRIGRSGTHRLPAANFIGIEVEVGLALKSDLDSAAAMADDSAIMAAIDHYFVGIEICGSRFVDRALAGATGGLADNVSALGYAMHATPRELGSEIDGIDVTVEFSGRQIHHAPAKHSFGTVLASYIAYAKAQHPAYPLKAGTLVTTGSLCGLVPAKGPGKVIARLGSYTLDLEMV